MGPPPRPAPDDDEVELRVPATFLPLGEGQETRPGLPKPLRGLDPAEEPALR